MTPQFDSKDEAIRLARQNQRNAITGPRIGDFVIMPDGREVRLAEPWPDGFQASNGGSYVLADNGGIAMSGGFEPGILAPADLVETGKVRTGSVWFFHHNERRAHNGVQTRIECRVYRYQPKVLKSYTAMVAFIDQDNRTEVTVEAESFEDACKKAVAKVDDGEVTTYTKTFDPGPTFVYGVVETGDNVWNGAHNVPAEFTHDGVRSDTRDPWGRDETYTPEDWADAVANGDTRSGYWDWVDSCREAEAEVAAA